MQNKRKSYQSNKATGTKYVSPSISVSEGYRGAVPSGRYGNARQMLSEEAYAAGPYGGSPMRHASVRTPEARRQRPGAGTGRRRGKRHTVTAKRPLRVSVKKRAKNADSRKYTYSLR